MANYDICIVGGMGHIGLSLSIAFANTGLKVCALDINKEALEIISKGKTPFKEEGAEVLLKKVLKNGMLHLSLDQNDMSRSSTVIITIGTPINIHLSVEVSVEKFIEERTKYLRDGQLLILRSTLYPGTTERIHNLLKKAGKKIDVAFCPERIAEGHAMKELAELPQIVSSTSKLGEQRASKLFKRLTKDILTLNPKEAELAKLFSNNLRYAIFAIANQFYMIANEAGCNYYEIRKAMQYKYPRAASLPKAGLAAGPCLQKDAIILSAFATGDFHIGNGAVQVNESLPLYIASRLARKYDLKNLNVGVLGLAFKEDSDDKRDSLAYKLINALRYEVKNLYYSDPYIKEAGRISAKDLIAIADIIILAAPHHIYANLKIPKEKVLVDIWNFYEKGGGL